MPSIISTASKDGALHSWTSHDPGVGRRVERGRGVTRGRVVVGRVGGDVGAAATRGSPAQSTVEARHHLVGKNTDPQ